jgi:predicted NAD/FAD-binding protein
VNIAVIGAGISGLGAAYVLSRVHTVRLFERESRLGGHAHTHTVSVGDRTWVVDTGFLVYNERTYPNFTRLLSQLGVQGQPSDMSFSVRCRRCRLEYASPTLRTLFAQPWRVADPRHLRLLLDITRFFGNARVFLASDRGLEVPLGTFLDEGAYGDGFARHFLLPMTGAIWSASFDDMRAFPAHTILRFLDNHGLLSRTGAPRWHTIAGGSHSYVRAIAARLGPSVLSGEPVALIRRPETGAEITTASGRRERFDKVVIATHADEALRLLADPSPRERELLGAFRYSRNRTVLHTDATALPVRRAAWASWNCDLRDCRDTRTPVSLTYHVNRLQGITGGPEFCVTLNGSVPAQGTVLAEMDYTHPIVDGAAVAAQPALAALNGERHTYYCGAHLRY